MKRIVLKLVILTVKDVKRVYAVVLMLQLPAFFSSHEIIFLISMTAKCSLSSGCLYLSQAKWFIGLVTPSVFTHIT